MIALPSPRRLRGLLAEHNVSRGEFARLCGLSPNHLSQVLLERREIGELTTFKLHQGLTLLAERGIALGSPTERSRAS